MAFIVSENIITSLGTTTEVVFENILNSANGIKDTTSFSDITEAPISVIDPILFNSECSSLKIPNEYTRFEKLSILSISKAIEPLDIDFSSSSTLLIISTTKGNIERLENQREPVSDGLVASAAKQIGNFFNCSQTPFVVCNACISGVLALSVGARYINEGIYDTVVVAGADIASKFVVSGFESFKSLSKTPCHPFDVDRTGLSLGEGAGTIVLSKTINYSCKPKIKITGAGSANDANHISGPSRTGEGLYLSAKKALGIGTTIDFISAHGTATPYNDDMESIAIERLKLQHIPVNSFKGYFGHTLGAAGIIETILTVLSMQKNILIGTLGLNNPGTTAPINLIKEHTPTLLKRSLKLSSGFGGCNAAIVLEKDGE